MKFAIDIPSGLNSDTGDIFGVCFQANATATFGGLKLGMKTENGSKHCGNIRVCYISTPVHLYSSKF